MSTLTNLIFNQYVISLAFLTISGFLIRTALVVSGQKWANTYHHLATCLLLPGIGYIITSIIKDDIALSLGMIGALSIIRFRNPVKSPFELVIFFALLTLGVATTTGLKLSFLLLILVLIVVLGIRFIDQLLQKFGFSLFQFSFSDGNSPHILEITSSKILDELQDEKKMVYFHFEKQSNQYVYRLIFNSKNELMEFKKSLEKNSSILDVRADMQG